jgi:hypothetical protein
LPGWRNKNQKKMENNIIKKIIEIFSTEEINQEEVEMNFVDVKTADGRILRVSDLALEADVQEMDVDGNLIAVADGDYELESGEVISVLDGKIAEIATPEEEEAEEAEDVAEDAVPVAAQMSKEDEEVENLEFESLISNLKELVAEVKALKETEARELLIAYVQGVKKIQRYMGDGRLNTEQKYKAITRIINDQLEW